MRFNLAFKRFEFKCQTFTLKSRDALNDNCPAVYEVPCYETY